jgi:hypothetical protein
MTSMTARAELRATSVGAITLIGARRATRTLLIVVIVALAQHFNVAVDVAAKRKTHFANLYEKREKAMFSGVRWLPLMSELIYCS